MKPRYCSSCETYQPIEGGQNVRNRSGKVVRWRCNACRIRALLRKDEIADSLPVIPNANNSSIG